MLDDDADVGLSAQLLLQRRVGPVRCLTRPAELLPTLQQWQPALLLLDLNFGPATTASKACVCCARCWPCPRTGGAGHDSLRRPAAGVQAIKLGAFDFVTKPWDNARLVATCHEALQDAPDASVQSPPKHPAPLPARSLAAQERAAFRSVPCTRPSNLSGPRQLGLSRSALPTAGEAWTLESPSALRCSWLPVGSPRKAARGRSAWRCCWR
ncbi:hypothetical protein [Roseateles sp.]|uniref:hypothetical protein n=1 Tax=Roseateles sp. TaxID=1971397 RepID=UPI003956457E